MIDPPDPPPPPGPTRITRTQLPIPGFVQVPFIVKGWINPEAPVATPEATLLTRSDTGYTPSPGVTSKPLELLAVNHGWIFPKTSTLDPSIPKVL